MSYAVWSVGPAASVAAEVQRMCVDVPATGNASEAQRIFAATLVERVKKIVSLTNMLGDAHPESEYVVTVSGSGHIGNDGVGSESMSISVARNPRARNTETETTTALAKKETPVTPIRRRKRGKCSGCSRGTLSIWNMIRNVNVRIPSRCTFCY